MRVAPPVVLTDDQKRTLQQWARGRSLPARQVERARVVLLAAAGKQDLEIAAEIGISNQKAARWRKRFLQFGLSRLGEGRSAARPHANHHSRPKCRKWSGRPRRRSPPTRPSGAPARWRKRRVSVRRACAGSGTSMV